jgi:hypothetical protein
VREEDGMVVFAMLVERFLLGRHHAPMECQEPVCNDRARAQ